MTTKDGLPTYKELVLGCGSRIKKDLYIVERGDKFLHPVTLDNNALHNPDVLWDLKDHPLPFRDAEFDEIHAYDVLEHLAQQGDYEFFFKEFTEYNRILKNGGLFFATVPSLRSPWLWGDPSHKRVICKETLVFLQQKHYEQQVGKTQMSEFRNLYKVDFSIVFTEDDGNKFMFCLRKE